MFREALDAGQDILYVGFSSGLSGTYHAGCMARDELAPHYPDRKIFCVDSLSATGGEFLLVDKAREMRDSGCTAEVTAAAIEQMRLHVIHLVTVDDLNHLKRGGRISAATALFGSMLSIKPVLHVDDTGHLVAVSKARGRKASLTALVDRMEQTAVDPKSQTVFISHGDCLEEAEFVAGEVRRRLGVEDIRINYIGPVIGNHAGPGTMALFFVGTKR